MAIFGNSNIIDAIRATKLVYWRIFQSAPQKIAGAFLASSDFENAQLGEKASYDDLQSAINRLTTGRYILLAYRTNSTKGGAAFESDIEVDGNGRGSVAGIGNMPTAAFYVEGIGMVEPDKFSEALEKKMQLHFEKLEREREDKALRDRVKQLEQEAKDAESGINKGLLAIGTVLYPAVSKTPAFAEVLGLVTNITKAANGSPAAAAQHLGNTSEQSATQNPQLPENHIEGDNCEIGGISVNQEELFSTLDVLGTDNKDVLQHLKILAKLKKDNPAMYNQAVEMAGSL